MNNIFYKYKKYLIMISIFLNIITILVLIGLISFDSSFRKNVVILPFKFLIINMSFIANVVKALGLFSIIFVYLGYRKSLRWRRFDYTIRVINEFRSDIIPKLAIADKGFHNRVIKLRRNIIHTITEKNFKKHPNMSRKKRKHVKIVFNKTRFDMITKNSVEVKSYYPIMNELEQLAIYDEKHVHIINDDLAYREMHNVFLSFFKAHKDMFNHISHIHNATYYCACNYLIKHWNRKRENRRWLKK